MLNANISEVRVSHLHRTVMIGHVVLVACIVDSKKMLTLTVWCLFEVEVSTFIASVVS